MKARIVNQRMKIRALIEKSREWPEQNRKYKENVYGWRAPKIIDDPGIVAFHAALAAMDPETATPEQVRSVFVKGNYDPTMLQCDGCEESAPEVVQVGEEPNQESRTAYLCRKCLAEAVAAMEGP